MVLFTLHSVASDLVTDWGQIGILYFLEVIICIKVVAMAEAGYPGPAGPVGDHTVTDQVSEYQREIPSLLRPFSIPFDLYHYCGRRQHQFCENQSPGTFS